MRHIQPPKKPVTKDWHPADIKAALEKKGWSLRRLALHHGFSGGYLTHVMRHKHFNAQQLIADTLGLKPQAIWPSRYDAVGEPIRGNPWIPIRRPACWAKPTRKCVTNGTESGGERNVKNRPAA